MRNLSKLKIEAYIDDSELNDSVQRLCGFAYSSVRHNILKKCILSMLFNKLDSQWIGDVGLKRILRNVKRVSDSVICRLCNIQKPIK